MWYVWNYCIAKTWANSLQLTILFLSNDLLSRIVAWIAIGSFAISRKCIILMSTILVTLFNDWAIQIMQYSRANMLYTVLLDIAKHIVDVSRCNIFNLFIFLKLSIICPMVLDAGALFSLLLMKWWIVSRWFRKAFYTLNVKCMSVLFLSPRAISTWLGVETLIFILYL